MTATVLSAPARHARIAISARVLTVLAMVALALAIRVPLLGSPVAGLDEQFYLLVGERFWQGALPYLDIWDRKPPGLFAIYAAIAALPDDGVLAYQLVATACLAATGWVTCSIARTIAPLPASIAAGAAVVVYGGLLGMGFGEAPIFYDLLIAAAVRLLIAPASRRRDLAAMLLAGVAITIKTSAAFEGAALGLYLVARDWRGGVPASSVVRRAAGWIAVGAAPMVALALGYAAIGGFGAFWFANVVSIFGKTGGGSAQSVAALVACLIMLAPVLVAGLGSIRTVPPPQRALLASWLAGAAAGFAAIGFFHFHYALPLTVPLAILSARTLVDRRAAAAVLAAVTLYAGASIVTGNTLAARDRQDVAALAALVPDDVRSGCLFVYEGPSILYERTHACLPGRYVFPGHFTDPAERGALERPSAMILRDTLRRRPAAIVSVPALRDGGAATDNDRILAVTLARDYRAIGARSVRLYGARRVHAVVWVRR